MMKSEILAPAPSFESLQFAVRNGANAVYAGLKKFNARRNAENFTLDELKLASEFCHIRGVSIYLTFNILIKDEETEDALNLLDSAVECGIDGIIVQDLGMALIIRSRYPTLKMHASTQLSVHNIDGVKELEKMGFSRVCLARELSFSEIKKIKQNTDIELEVFVHGAHCMSVSGQCYFSSVIGQRSGNRGLCGQACRLPFNNREITHALSLKDLSIIESLPELAELGISSFKIEGRMKRPEYVKSAVKACRAALNKDETFDFEYDRLKNVFSRSGFTRGYFDDNRTADMFGIRRKEDIASEKLLKELRNDEKEMPLIPLTARYIIKKNQKISFEITDGKNNVKAISDFPQEALNREITAEEVENSLCKFGGTPYYTEGIDGYIDSGLFVSKKELNDLRRRATELLTEERQKINIIKPNVDIEQLSNHTRKDKKGVIATFEKSRQIPENLIADEFYLSYFAPVCDFEKLIRQGENPGIMLPDLLFDNQEGLTEKLAELKRIGVNKAFCNNLYAVRVARNSGFSVMTGTGLNAMNSYSVRMLEELGVDKICLSFEMSKREINAVKSKNQLAVMGYGYIPLMLTRACPLSFIGCGKCREFGTFTDRLGNKFELLCKGEYQKLLNTVPLSVGREEDEFNVDYLLFSFTCEKKERVEEILDAFSKHENPQNDGFTRGLYNKGVM